MDSSKFTIVSKSDTMRAFYLLAKMVEDVTYEDEFQYSRDHDELTKEALELLPKLGVKMIKSTYGYKIKI